MNTTEGSTQDTGFESCDSCSRQTAAQYMRKIGKRSLCIFCANKEAEADKRMEAAALDKQHHGSGWFWQHLAKCVIIAIIIMVIRYGWMFLRH